LTANAAALIAVIHAGSLEAPMRIPTHFRVTLFQNVGVAKSRARVARRNAIQALLDTLLLLKLHLLRLRTRPRLHQRRPKVLLISIKTVGSHY
jgi:hypothetical protein